MEFLYLYLCMQDKYNIVLSLVNDLRITESEPSKMHNVRPYVYSRPWLYSFLKKGTKACEDNVAMISSDAKCKVSVGESGTPIASVSRGKGYSGCEPNLTNYWSWLIPDATFIQKIPDADDDTWYRGKVFYSIKDMTLQGSTALRGGVELSEALDSFFGTEIPERLYLYADGGDDRRVTHLQVQKALIALFIHHDLDELIAARPAACQSYRNPVESCNAISNLGLMVLVWCELKCHLIRSVWWKKMQRKWRIA